MYFINFRSGPGLPWEEEFHDIWAHTQPLPCALLQRGSQSSKDAHSRGNNKRSYLVHCLCSQQRPYLKFFFLARRAEWEWFHILALGVPTLHGVTRVTAFILDPEKTVVLFLQTHLMVVRCFCENCSCELPDGCMQHSCCGIFEKETEMQWCFKWTSLKNHVTPEELA